MTKNILQTFPEYAHEFELYEEQYVKTLAKELNMFYCEQDSNSESNLSCPDGLKPISEQDTQQCDSGKGLINRLVFCVIGDPTRPRFNHIKGGDKSNHVYILVLQHSWWWNVRVMPPDEFVSIDNLMKGYIHELYALLSCIYGDNWHERIQISIFHYSEFIPVIWKEKLL